MPGCRWNTAASWAWSKATLHPDTLRARFPRLSQEATARLLDELVERGLLEAVEAMEQHDFDFTNTLNLADLQKAAG